MFPRGAYTTNRLLSAFSRHHVAAAATAVGSKQCTPISNTNNCTKYHQLTSRSFSVTSTSNSGHAALPVAKAPFNGIIVDPGPLMASSCSLERSQILKTSVSEWRTAGKTAAWLTIPLARSELMAEAANHGWVFHNAENDTATLINWLCPTSESRVPPFATHQVGVAGFVYHQGQVLVVREAHYSSKWKLPGGLADLGEDIGVTATRETLEETGIKSTFQSILGFRHQHNVGFHNRSDIYVICKLNPVCVDSYGNEISLEPTPQLEEIEACRWMDVDQFIHECQHPMQIQVRYFCWLCSYGVIFIDLDLIYY